MTRAKTSANALYLAPTFLSAMEKTYGGTRLGRQELDGEYIDNHPGALWTRLLIERCRIDRVPELETVIVAIDPPTTSGPKSDRCGLIVAGRFKEAGQAKAVILHDGSVQGLTPEGWARQALSLYEDWDADFLLAEVNQGGDMVRTILSTLDPLVPLQTVYATRAKAVRAEPVAMLYEQACLGDYAIIIKTSRATACPPSVIHIFGRSKRARSSQC